MHNAKVYPITHALETQAIDAGIEITEMPYRAMLEVVGEYEHGTAEVELNFEDVDLVFGEGEDADEFYTSREALKAYAAVTLDLMLSIHNFG